MVNFAKSNGITPGALVGQYLANPDDLPASVKAIAQKHRMDPATLKAQVDRVVGAFTLQVTNRMKAQGFTYDDVLAWEAKNVDPGDAKRGRLRLALHGDMSYFDNLCRAYKTHTVPLKHEAGVVEREARDPTNGQMVTLVKIPGYREMRAETAARMGLI
jgi:hypothetical protein